MTTTIAPATINADALTKEQLISLRDQINNENDSAFDYLFEGIHDAVRGYASILLAQSLSTADTDVEPTDDAIDSLTDDLFGKVSVLIQIDGLAWPTATY